MHMVLVDCQGSEINAKPLINEAIKKTPTMNNRDVRKESIPVALLAGAAVALATAGVGAFMRYWVLKYAV